MNHKVWMITFLGKEWGRGEPRFSVEQITDFSRKVADVGGVITWDTPIQKNGTFAPELLAQLKAIGVAMAPVKSP